MDKTAGSVRWEVLLIEPQGIEIKDGVKGFLF